MALQHPDLVIGIDVGMTGTGVAYCSFGGDVETREPTPFTDWENGSIARKIPTQLVYDRRNIKGDPIAWGSSELESTTDSVSGHWFKQGFTLSPDQNSDNGYTDADLPSVDTLYQHFLSKLYNNIRTVLGRELGGFGKDWEDASIDFLFSVPAIWDSQARERFKYIATKAGFGCHSTHRVLASLAEPEAAAIFEINREDEKFQDGDTVLVVDAGGATTDLCLVRVDKKEKTSRLSELEPVTGDNVGGTYIDGEFQKLIADNLSKVDLPKTLAWKMISGGQFMKYKIRLNGGRAQAEISLEVPGLGRHETFEQCDIRKGKMFFKYDQLVQIFDEQIEDIAVLIDGVLNDMVMSQQGQLNHIILAGGLGSSAYVQKQLKGRYNADSLGNPPNVLKNVVFHVSSEPQLCVCQGLVYEYIHSIYNGSSTFTKLSSQFSFGIMRDELYSIRKQSHRAAKKHGRVKKTPMGNEQWVSNCVDWLILRGALMNPGEKTAKELHHRFERSVRRTDLRGRITIVSSAEDEPPKYFDSTNGVKKHRILYCDYSNLKVSSKPWYSLERDYQQVDFKIEAQFGAEDVKFECLSLDGGEKLSKDPVIIQAKTMPQEVNFPQSLLFA